MTISAAVDALETVWRNALDAAGMTGVRLFDGPDVNRQMAGEVVTVGAAFEDDQSAVSVAREERGAALRAVDTAEVACSVYVGSGDVAVETHRARVSQILGVLDDALRADRTLGGAVGLARITSSQWMQGRDQHGTGVAVGLLVGLWMLP